MLLQSGWFYLHSGRADYILFRVTRPFFPPPAPPTNRRGKGLRLGGAADHLKSTYITRHQRLPHWLQWVQCVELEANAPQYQSHSIIAKTSLFVTKKVNPVRQLLELAGRISGLLVQNNGTCCICLMTLPPPPPPPPPCSSCECMWGNKLNPNMWVIV